MEPKNENLTPNEATELTAETTAAPAEVSEPLAAPESAEAAADAAEQSEESAAEAVAETENAGVQLCASCHTELQPGQQFCPKCGARAGAVPETNQAALEEFNRNLKEKKKKKKKRTLLIFAAIIALIVLGIGGKAAYTGIRHSTGLAKAKKTVEQYNNDKIDYDEAITTLTALKGSKDSDVASNAVSSEKTVEMLKESKDHFAKGELYKGKSEYNNAVTHYNAVIKDDANYEKAQAAIQEIIPLWKKTIPSEVDALLKENKTDDAQKLVTTFLGYSDDESIGAIGQFIDAESNYKKGYLNTAKAIYQKLPTTLKVNGVTVQARLDTLKKYDLFVKLCGKWELTKCHIETKEVWRSGRWHSWNNDYTSDSDSYMEVTCVINKDGTVTTKFNYKFYSYTNYSSISEYVKASYFTDSYTKKLPIPSDGKLLLSFSTGNYTRNDSQKITFNGSSIGLNCTFKYYYSQSCTEYYMSNNTFGKRAEKY